jgi:FMN-dependent NADH-azoreductase
MSKLLHISASLGGDRSASIGVAKKFIVFVEPTLAKADAVETETKQAVGLAASF